MSENLAELKIRNALAADFPRHGYETHEEYVEKIIKWTAPIYKLEIANAQMLEALEAVFDELAGSTYYVASKHGDIVFAVVDTDATLAKLEAALEAARGEK